MKKIIKHITKLIICCFATQILYAQNPNRTYLNYKSEQGILKIQTSDGEYQITPRNPQIIETSFIPSGEAYHPNSHTTEVEKNPAKTELIISENTLNYNTSGIQVRVTKSPFQIEYFYKNKPLTSEKRGYVKTDSTDVLEFNLNSTEVLYGGGARVLGMNRRGNRLELYNKAHYGYETRAPLMNYTMPLVVSSENYMIHFDNAPIGFLDLDSKKDNTLSYETISGRKTYQVIAGNDWKATLNAYTSLTGKQPLPPRWALGNFASRFGYHSQKEVEDVVARFKNDSIPLDAVILDIYWFGKEMKGTMGNLEFYKDSFPTPKKMINDLKQKGVKTILITEPFVLSTSKKWEEAVAEKVLATDSLGNPYQYDFYFGNTGLIDIFKPEARQWFWDIYKDYNNIGVAGWWGDLGEPEVHPADLKHAIGSANELHNIYGHEWAKLIYGGYQKDFPKQRSFILMRSGYSGSQRYGIIPWSGDVNRSWGGLQSQPEIALQMGLQGLGYMHSDLGGFAGGETFDSELYTRWLQYGVFQPIFRPHAQEHIAPEPVFHNAETKALAKQAIELRYSLLAYNYNLAFENSQTGIPLMCPLFFEEPTNTRLYTNSSSYLWGNDLLVTPILKPGVTAKEIYFPNTSNWFNFYENEEYIGGTTHQIITNKNHIPVFVRGGAFIPKVPIVQSTDDYSLQNFELHYFFDSNISESKRNLYNDDGKTSNAFEKGAYELLTFEGRNKRNKLKITVSHTHGSNYKTTSKNIQLIIHNIYTKPKKVLVSKKKQAFKWNEEKNTLEISLELDAMDSKEIEIKLEK